VAYVFFFLGKWHTYNLKSSLQVKKTNQANRYRFYINAQTHRSLELLVHGHKIIILFYLLFLMFFILICPKTIHLILSNKKNYTFNNIVPCKTSFNFDVHPLSKFYDTPKNLNALSTHQILKLIVIF